MLSRAAVAMSGLLVLACLGGCGEQPGSGRVTLLPAAAQDGAAQDGAGLPSAPPTPPTGPTGPSGTPHLAASPSEAPSIRPSGSPPVRPSGSPPMSSPMTPPGKPALVSSLAEASATGAALPVTGPPRFFVAANLPAARFPEGSKEAVITPVPPSVHDAATGRFIAAVPLPPGVESSWKLGAAAPDNRTFLFSGTSPAGTRFFRVRLGDDGRPGAPELVPDTGARVPGVVPALALSHDGSRFAFADLVPGGSVVSVVEVTTGRRRDWHSGDALVTGLSWAPDGRSLAVVSSPQGLGVLDLTSPETDLFAATRILRPASRVPPMTSVAYTPDGAALVYAVGYAVERIPADGGVPALLAKPEPPKGASLAMRFDVDGTGRHLLFTHAWRMHRLDLRDGTTSSVRIDRGDLPRGSVSPDAAW
ncbi:hypothetical protein [Nonomuraea sp. NPDC023979]|uniref:hypothetical protein n=1 Tax=Nonomuraea sp. NPDC023979 TaxID=3154796 RepID=UPI0033F18B86